MLKKRLAAIIFFILSISTFSFGVEFAPNCSIDIQPNWVKEIPLENGDILEKGQNFELVLKDQQIHLDEETRFTHFAKRLLNQNGVQQHSQIEIEFDPSFESLVLHKIHVHRNQVTSDRISSCHMEVIQQEQELDFQLYNGRKKWVIFLEDVQPGDIIEYAYSKKGKNPIFKGIADGTIWLEHEEPILYSYFRMIDGSQRSLFFKTQNTSLTPTLLTFPEHQEWTWELKNIVPTQFDPLCPHWFLAEPVIQISESKNWAEVAQWGTKIFEVLEAPSQEIKELVDNWNNQPISSEEKILKAIRFVQDEVRYLGFERGIHTHMPTQPNIVFKRRFGDCKDKTLLLKTFLELMNVESYPVLVNSGIRDHLSDWHPSPLMFDHVILQVCLNEKKYYVDSTHLFEGGNLEKLQCNLFQKGLILNEKTTDLTDFPKLSPAPLIVTSTTFELANSKDTVICKIKKDFKDFEANYMRNLCTQNKPKEFEKFLCDLYAKKYGQLEVMEPLKIQDDRENNQVSLEMAFEISNLWNLDDEETIKSFKFSPVYISDSCELNFSLMRKSPLYLDYPCYTVEDFYFINPEQEWTQESSQNKYESDEIAFFTEVAPNKHQLHVHFEMSTKKDHVPFESLKNHRSILKKIEDQLFLSLSLPTEVALKNAEISDGTYTLFKCLFVFISLANLGWYFTREYRKRKIGALVNQG
ncbi:DUF3857 domain-containing protein [Parachlamydia sp.]|uniref:DUF3857 domain-containing protein n=1 Tax=Parachlamydia sp. TaxID=2052048 RepID=UPI003D11A87F